MRVLGIDTALRNTGVGVVEAGSRIRLVECGVIHSPAKDPHSVCLRRLHEELRDLIARAKPEVAALEGAFFAKNAQTAMVLGQARGVVIAVCACAGLPVYEYEPRRVKLAVAGYGAASKEQMTRMVVSLLGLETTPPEDACDALAMALCHLQARTTVAELRPEPI